MQRGGERHIGSEDPMEVKYLSFTIDGKWSFKPHWTRLAPRVEGERETCPAYSPTLTGHRDKSTACLRLWSTRWPYTGHQYGRTAWQPTHADAHAQGAASRVCQNSPRLSDHIASGSDGHGGDASYRSAGPIPVRRVLANKGIEHRGSSRRQTSQSSGEAPRPATGAVRVARRDSESPEQLAPISPSGWIDDGGNQPSTSRKCSPGTIASGSICTG